MNMPAVRHILQTLTRNLLCSLDWMQMYRALVLMRLWWSFAQFSGDVSAAALCFCHTLPLTSRLISGYTFIIHCLLSISTLLLCLCVTSSVEQAEPRDKKKNKGVKKNEAQILLTAAKKCISLFIICIVRLYRGTCCQLTEINLRFWQMQLFYLQCWKLYLQQKAFLHHFDFTRVNIIQLSVWLCRTAIMSIRLHLYSRHWHPQKKCLGAEGGKVLFVSDSAKVISSLAFNKACRRCRWYNLSPPGGV